MNTDNSDKNSGKIRMRGSMVSALTIISLVSFLGIYVLLEDNLTGMPTYQSASEIELKENLHKAREHLRAMRYDESEQLLRAALWAAPTNATAHNILGYVLKKQDRLDEAIAFYEKAISLRQPYPFHEARNNLAVALEAAGRVREAEGLYLRALRDAPAAPALHLNYGLMLESEERYEEAIGQYYTFINLTRDLELKSLVSERIASLR